MRIVILIAGLACLAASTALAATSPPPTSRPLPAPPAAPAVEQPASEPADPGWTCLGEPATVVGTAGDDFLEGTQGPDVIVGFGGRDTIYARRGNDTICAGPGTDRVFGGPGADLIVGGGGDDYIEGGPGPDVIEGREGADRLLGGRGDDRLSGGPGDDDLAGHQGDDLLAGWLGSDHLDGGLGSETVNGGPGPDTCGRGSAYRQCEQIERNPIALPAGSYGFPTASRSFDAQVADFDGDGRDDVLITHHANRVYFPEIPADGIYFNRGDTFVKEVTFPLADRHGCAAGDVNGDGMVDVYCQMGGKAGEATDKVDELWIQTPGGGFIDRYARSGVEDKTGRGRYPILLDADGDGDLDLYLTNTYRSDGLSVNSLWRNRDNGFTLDADSPLTGIADWGPCADAAADLVALCGGGEVRLFRRNGEGYREIEMPGTAIRSVVRHAALADLDGDGSPELVIAHDDGAEIRSLGDGRRTAIATGQSRAVAVGDFDGDGHRDVYIVRAGTGCLDPDAAENRDDMMLYGPDFGSGDSVAIEGGCGDRATAIDVDHDGNDEVLVLNGHLLARGPILVVELY